ncbi:MAG: hypothetical protein WD604_08760 [Balneolaceae bacterium]
MKFNFWTKWLLFVSILYVIAGLIIAFLPDSLLFAFHTSAIEFVFFDGSMPEDANRLRSFLFGPLGATISGYFLMQAFIVRGPFQRREPWAWHAVLWPLLIWFTIDSGMSIYHGAFFNVWMLNIWTLFLVGLPLLMTRPAFKENRR